MAGGANGRIVPCMECAGPAVRIYEGQETDHYRCERCGAEHGVDWRGEEPPEPAWPIPAEEAEAIRRFAAERRGDPG